MKIPFALNQLPIDAQAITDTIQRAMASAGLDTTTGPMRNVTETIRQALGSRPLSEPARPPASDPSIIDVDARVVDVDASDVREGVAAHRETTRPQTGQPPPAGALTTRRFSSAAGTRSYKVYAPTGSSGERSRPVVVMLHGCTQSADDFARGTQMNRLADQHGVLIVYPEQDAKANPSKCWNWFSRQDQTRDQGEPAVIAGIVREVIAEHRADPDRVFVAGLSAGAAMAVILGETYPELFAAVGAHSGLPFGSAHDVASALAAMKGGRRGGPVATSTRQTTHPVPTIVFHGNRDHTVQQKNGARIVEQAQAAFQGRSGSEPLRVVSEQGVTATGRRFDRTRMVDKSGIAQIEEWTLHGAGHAWSGGDASGSFTDGSGPDASAEMLRFFLARAPVGTA